MKGIYEDEIYSLENVRTLSSLDLPFVAIVITKVNLLQTKNIYKNSYTFKHTSFMFHKFFHTSCQAQRPLSIKCSNTL